MFASRLALRGLRAAPLAACAAGATQKPADCGWFGGKSEAAKLEAEKKRLEEEMAAVREKLGVLAALDLNGDGKVDEKDAALALEMAKNRAMTAGGDELLAEIGKHASTALATGVPSQLSWGFCSGYCAGFAAKKASKVVAVGLGGIFALMQALAYNGFIVVDQEKLRKDFQDRFDVNHDGKIDMADAENLYGQAMEVLQYNMPSGTGFATGVVLGLRSG